MRLLSKSEAIEALREHQGRLLRSEHECVMCALVARGDGLPSIQENEHGIVRLDRFGSRPGHLLVISRRHVERFTELPFSVYSELQRLAFDACRALERLLAPKRVFVAALGTSNPLLMSYPHYHLHVVPVCEDDERGRPAAVFSWSEGVLLYEAEEAAEFIAATRAAWPGE